MEIFKKSDLEKTETKSKVSEKETNKDNVNFNICSISDEMVGLLEKQVSHEINNYMIYTNFASYYEKMRLLKLSQYFKERADEELEHSYWIKDFLNACNADWLYPEVKPVKEDITNNMTPLIRTIEVEKGTTAMINNLCKKAIELNDFIALQWLMDGRFLVKEQLEEEEISFAIYMIASNMADENWTEIEDAIIEYYEKHMEEEENEKK